MGPGGFEPPTSTTSMWRSSQNELRALTPKRYIKIVIKIPGLVKMWYHIRMKKDLETIKHSTAHVMASAILQIWPQVKFGVGPSTSEGFYYDIDLGDNRISETDFAAIEEKMIQIVQEDHLFVNKTVTLSEALVWAEKNNQPYKKELIDDIQQFGTTKINDIDSGYSSGVDKSDNVDDAKQVTLYQTGDFVDLCRGPHVKSTKEIDTHFKLIRVAGAYWRGDEKKPQMQRVYGVVFSTKKDLDEYLNKLEEAKLRDHRKLGQELDLFCFSPLIGPGLPIYTVRGALVLEKLQNYTEQVCREYGFCKVKAPHLAKKILYETSGHAAKFSEELFSVTSEKGHNFILKPVLCPHHTQVFDSKIRSYKDLPVRYMESDKQYRAEKSGEIGGLNRVYAITIEDGHVFCTIDQIEEEIKNLVNIIKDFYGSLGLWGNHWVSLSVRDYQHPEKYIGDTEDWDLCESLLQKVSDEMELGAVRREGEAALYGPKLDFMFKDAMDREVQIPTIQLDFATPKRFNLQYTEKDGKTNPPVMIHRAILGSYERFLALLLEHFSGWLPFWMAPEQVRVLTVNNMVDDYVDEVEKILKQVVLMQPLKYNELRYTVDVRNESLGKKIHEAKLWRVPVQIIIGNKDKENGEVSIKTREKETKVPLRELTNFLIDQSKF